MQGVQNADDGHCSRDDLTSKGDTTRNYRGIDWGSGLKLEDDLNRDGGGNKGESHA